MEEVQLGVQPKKKNPYDRANLLSLSFFCWLCPYFLKGYKRELTEDDMYRHRKVHDSEMLGDRLEAAWENEIVKKKEPSLAMALLRVFGMEIALLSIIPILSEGVKIIQPLVISELLTLYDNNIIEENKESAYMYAAAIIMTMFLNTATIHYLNLRLMQVGMKMRVACCALIYRKALKLSKTALAETTIGQMVNLLSNDVGRFDSALHSIHQLWMGPGLTITVMYFTYNTVGYAGLVGIIFLLLTIPVQSYLGKMISKFRLKTALKTDERVRLMNEIISGIQVIKMYTWEKPFAKIVEIIRLKEMKYIRNTSVVRAIVLSSSLLFNRCAIYLCILTYVLTGNVLTSAFTYTLTSYYRLLGGMTMFFPQAVANFSEMLISIKRIKMFLLYDEINPVSLPNSKAKETNGVFRSNGEMLAIYDTNKDVGIELKDVCVKWLKSSSEYNLKNVTMTLGSSNLVTVVGPVGCGKSTLLHVILKEIPVEEGYIKVNGSISYASQEPWLFGGSVRQNILFGQKFDQKKYDEVIRVCALERDLTLFPHGDRTLAGERGVTLSGGQRARINLARAVYRDADIYLLDDPLSAVDTHVGKQLFDDCICGYLRNKCVILVTHQLQYLKDIENICLLEQGQVVVQGNYEAIKSSKNVFNRLLAEIEHEEEEVRRKSRLLPQPEEKKEEHEVQVLQREAKGTGNISWHVYKSYMKAGGSWLKLIFIAIIFLFSQITDSLAEYFITFWINIEQWRSNIANANITELDSVGDNITETLISGANSFEGWWLLPVYSDDYTIVYYTIVFISIIITTYSRSLMFYNWALTSSTRMHNWMFDNIVYSPMRFFNENPSGRILNRFSKDIGSLDETLPMTLLDTIQIGLSVAAISLIIGSLSAWIFVPTLVIVGIFYLLRVVFLETSRDVKRVEAVTRSPIYTHLTASLQGLTTIRAFRAEQILRNEFDTYQNTNSAAFFMFLGANRVFGFWLDFICVIYVACVIAALLFIKSETFGGNMGLALTQAMGLMGMFQWGMRQWSELENQFTSVERVQEFADLKQESDEKAREPPKYWPEHGNVEFRNLSLQYSPKDPYVLRDLSFDIKAKEKIGIVGRTGAGKSSLIQALFRLAHTDGQILIDNVDSKTVSLNTLRSKISIIPQEPILFSGTLRKNLDPFDEYKDDVIWSALEQTKLKNAVEELASGLDSKMSEGGSNFSVGQRQLVCLARAVIRNNKVLVLDEATANVDPHTDGLIQETIRKEFADCTVLTIAHRLHTIMDSDKVLVMDAGRKVEFDHPHILLKNEKGVFYSLVMQTGKTTSNNLKAIAQEAYHQQHHRTTDEPDSQ